MSREDNLSAVYLFDNQDGIVVEAELWDAITATIATFRKAVLCRGGYGLHLWLKCNGKAYFGTLAVLMIYRALHRVLERLV